MARALRQVFFNVCECATESNKWLGFIAAWLLLLPRSPPLKRAVSAEKKRRNVMHHYGKATKAEIFLHAFLHYEDAISTQGFDTSGRVAKVFNGDLSSYYENSFRSREICNYLIKYS